MIGLPKQTEMSKQLSKKVIYTKFNMKTAEKEKIDADISRISIVNEVSASRVNIAEGETVKGFFVLLVSLKRKCYDTKSIITISKIIQQNMLMILECDGEAQLAVFHTKLIQSDWKPLDNIVVELRGLNLDIVWENIIVQIGNIEVAANTTLEEQLVINDKRTKLEKQIAQLEKQARAEKQPKKKFELVQKIKAIKNNMGEL